MVLNYIWIAFFVIAFVVAVVQTFVYGNTGIWTDIMNASFSSARSAFDISLGLTGVLTLWLGLMKIGERGGVVAVLSRWISPLFSRLFPGVPKGHPALGSMFMNVSANMLGLDNAATPLGLKAMRELQELNPKKDTATDAMLMFLVLNASGLTLIPIGVTARVESSAAVGSVGGHDPVERRFEQHVGDLVDHLVRHVGRDFEHDRPELVLPAPEVEQRVEYLKDMFARVRRAFAAGVVAADVDGEIVRILVEAAEEFEVVRRSAIPVGAFAGYAVCSWLRYLFGGSGELDGCVPADPD